MAISLEEVDRIEKLVKLEYPQDEKQKLRGELSEILNYVDMLKQVQDKAELKHFEDKDAVNLMRDDVAEQLQPPGDFLAQAPDREGNFFKVKSVLE
ncbi:MAG: Asp-tRNA(Asn)/Glu-tRNA(Gln) amidotransferase subunit GatC [Candidatus Saccharibacteria bacterium]